jgi:hypothetical protein
LFAHLPGSGASSTSSADRINALRDVRQRTFPYRPAQGRWPTSAYPV